MLQLLSIVTGNEFARIQGPRREGNGECAADSRYVIRGVYFE